MLKSEGWGLSVAHPEELTVDQLPGLNSTRSPLKPSPQSLRWMSRSHRPTRKLRQGEGNGDTAGAPNQNAAKGSSLENSRDKCQSGPQLTFLQPHLP